ncbi:MAG TPA: 50S ribosomal protein L28 [Candidatus Peregrinibacteria bacterium]|nr:50S ribosomal protein L28 [Candidatus Peregrinibacteria bacterium]
MARVCDICGKGPVSGQNRSHSMRATKRRFLPNLIRKRIFDPKTKSCIKVRICTRCNRTFTKQTNKVKKMVEA